MSVLFSHQISLLIKRTTDSDEAIVFTGKWATDSQQIPTQSLYKQFLRANFGNAASLVGKQYSPSLFASAAKALIQSSDQISQLGFNTTSLAIFMAMTEVISDSTYKCPAYYGAAQATRKGIPAWTYEFSHNPTCPWLSTIVSTFDSTLWGGSHTSEIPFVFGNLDNSYLPNQTCNSTSAEWKLGGQIMDLWTAMAEKAEPSTDEVHWPKFQNQGKNYSIPGLLFKNSTVPGAIDYSACELWTRVNAMLKVDNATATGAPSQVSGTSTSSPSPIYSNAASMLSFKSNIYFVWSALFMGLAAYF